METLKDFLIDNGYSNLHEMSDGTFVGTMPLLFTVGVFIGLDSTGYKYRYCYQDLVSATGALKDWADRDFAGEPSGYIKRKP